MKKSEPIVTPIVRRKPMVLSCSKCGRKTPAMMVFEDPYQAEGWPMHRCGLDIAPFDTSKETELVKKSESTL